jgi:hypothetical protein
MRALVMSQNPTSHTNGLLPARGGLLDVVAACVVLPGLLSVMSSNVTCTLLMRIVLCWSCCPRAIPLRLNFVFEVANTELRGCGCVPPRFCSCRWK